ncbi:DUF4268 domain-containing protein [Sphingobacterium lactis]|uniref:DUF4268 domain-containing protein n=1 Tax=Sphingobacterium lactis TaxID=797291 RepID=A0A1H6C1E6_9SPHI|nr:DUF4268 domain-containing protein [Sphingobacterium lactis]SEG66537.1 protein of unknown function [Sphingobacterium lactis]
MYSREEAKKIKESFWTSFGQYMAPVPSADGEKVTWVNYKTGIRNLYFRMDASNKVAQIGIVIADSDAGIRALIFEQFQEYRTVLHAELGEEWIWDAEYYDEYGKATARIYTEIRGSSIFNQQDWPALISFFKPRIMALDSFWSTAQYGFEMFKY